jgi:saccharopine dehydrogenase-like NADP-dependent oxidoreductase
MMSILRNEISGLKDGQPKKIIQQVIDYRDLKTGFMAMNRTVGFTASIVAQMILNGKITGSGMLNPGVDVPYEEFLAELTARGIKVEQKVL